MGLFRRTLTGRADRSSSTSSFNASQPPNLSGTSTPTPAPGLSTSPTHSTAPSLTKTTSRLGLSKTLTWGSKRKEEKERRRIEDWEKCDMEEWCAPSKRRGGKNSKAHQEILRSFEWKMGRGSIEGGRSRSMFSGVSPGCSRMGSVDDGQLHRVASGPRKGSYRDTSHGEAPGTGIAVGPVREA